jgi:hypothetical protein
MLQMKQEQNASDLTRVVEADLEVGGLLANEKKMMRPVDLIIPVILT